MNLPTRFTSLLLQLAIVITIAACSLFDKEDSDLSEILQCKVQDPLNDLAWLVEIVQKEESYDRRPPIRIWVGDYEGTGVIIYENLVSSCYLCNVYDCEGNYAFDTSLKGADKENFMAKIKNVKVLYSYKWVD